MQESLAMKLSDAGELSLLEILRKRFGKRSHSIVLGIGDDAAVIRPQNSHMLLTTDMMVEGVHFDLSWTTPFQLGFKLVSVNVSDIYAMGGKPKFLLLNFSASKDTTLEFFSKFFDGIETAMKRYGISLIGGDISASEKIVLSATVTGYAKKFLARRGARAGDRIYVTGHTGDAACGLALMKGLRRKIAIEQGKKQKFPLPWEIVSPLIERHLMPVARDSQGFIKAATSMIDISDGLMIDISRLCRESKVGALVYADKIPLSNELQLYRRSHKDRYIPYG
ncbi:MAG: thiamine-phosphate kinase [Nitrospira bacterium HGW-Nitrospira-1]|nr:MAG: thiamine-phosphate kinase [Nitrospira bacterium HGW-Nitrospira-1]